jgi:hypothetical protein
MSGVMAMGVRLLGKIGDVESGPPAAASSAYSQRSPKEKGAPDFSSAPSFSCPIAD